MSQCFRLALVGCGEVAQYHLSAVDALSDFLKISVIIDPSAQRRAAHRYPSLRSLEDLNFNDCDAVVIASPTDLHAEHAAYSLTSGRPVLIEKPAVTALNDWSRLTKTASLSGVPIETAFHSRFSPERRWFQSVKHRLTAEHGAICALHSRAEDPYAKMDGLQTRATSLSGSWLDSGVNALAGLDMLVEDWEVTSIRHAQTQRDINTASTATVQFDRRGLKRAGLGFIETSWHGERSWKETVLVFEETGAHLRLVHSEHRAEITYADGRVVELFSAPIERRRLHTHYAGVYRAFVRVLLGGSDNRALSSAIHQQLLGATDPGHERS